MMEKKYARLAALLAAAVLCGNGAPSMAAELVGNEKNGWHIVINSDYNGDVYGNKDEINTTTGAVTGHVEMTGGTVTGDVLGGYSYGYEVSGSTVTITDGTVNGVVYGGSSKQREAIGNTVEISGGEVTWDVFGGSSYWREAIGNKVKISGGKVTGDVIGGYSSEKSATYNTVEISGDSVIGDVVYGGLGYRDSTAYNTVTITGGTVTWGVCGGKNDSGEVSYNTVTITDRGKVNGDVIGGYSSEKSATYNKVAISGGEVTGDVYGGYSDGGSVANNTVALLGSANVKEASLYGRNDDASTGSSGNTLLIDGWSGSAKLVKNFDEVTFRNIRWKTGGTVLDITDNSQNITDNSQNITDNSQTGALKGTIIHLDSISFAGGTELQTDGSMTFINGDNLGIQEENVKVADTFTAGVAAVGTGEMSVINDGNTLSYKITGAFRNTQTDLIAENRAVAAAFVNQGADIAADSLRLLDDGYHYGTQTFGAVYGNRSQYDVNSDIKINGWSEIAGFGNIHEVKGGRLAWGVFYENGTGNYRTWNTFNNEMFRGDGSLLYNGGGAAIRLTKDSGMYGTAMALTATAPTGARTLVRGNSFSAAAASGTFTASTSTPTSTGTASKWAATGSASTA